MLNLAYLGLIFGLVADLKVGSMCFGVSIHEILHINIFLGGHIIELKINIFFDCHKVYRLS